MKLTPLDLRKQQFRKAFRGYDPDEVRGFIEKLAQDWEEVLEDKRRNDERVEVAEEKLRHYEKVELALQEALEAARETGRRAEDAAHQRAKLIIEEAELRAQRILQDAEQERYNVRQDLVKLNSRQNEIAARLRAFLMSEMEILAQFQGDDPIGFIKLVAATEGAAHEALPGPRARLGPAAPAPEQPALPFDEDEAPEAPAVEAPAAPEAREETPVTELTPPPVPPRAEEPAPASAEVAAPEEEAALEEEAAPEAAPAAEVPPPPPPAEPPPPAREPTREPAREPARPAESPAVPTYRDWLSGLAARREPPKPAEKPAGRTESEERTREVPAFGRPFFRPPAAEPPPPEPAPTSDAARGWSLRSLVTGDSEEGKPSVVASDDERERIRRILEDLD